MQAMVEGVTTLNGAGQCNEGFVRDDAILVVTIITDEEENGDSVGNPASWAQALIDAKLGNEQAVVVLGLIGDIDLPGSPCEDLDAMPSPRLRQFVSFFTNGVTGSVCAPDYAPFFLDAVSVIDTACDEFTPEG
jgi:hypothetical protein